MSPARGHLTVGDVARQARVNVQTVHYYERRGLIPEPARNESNYRVYGTDTPRRIRFVQRAQELGFSLKEIGELLSLRARPQAGCADVLATAKTKIQDIDEKIRSLRSMRQALSKLTAECAGRGGISECPILDALDDDNDS